MSVGSEVLQLSWPRSLIDVDMPLFPSLPLTLLAASCKQKIDLDLLTRGVDSVTQTRHALGSFKEEKMIRLLHSSSGIRVGASISAMALVSLVASADVARGQGVGLGTGSAACELANTSTITLLNATLQIPPLEVAGSLDISVDNGAVTCNIIEFDPINIAGVGFICITPPEDSCPSGILACPSDGGAGLPVCMGDCDDSGSVDVSELQAKP